VAPRDSRVARATLEHYAAERSQSSPKTQDIVVRRGSAPLHVVFGRLTGVREPCSSTYVARSSTECPSLSTNASTACSHAVRSSEANGAPQVGRRRVMLEHAVPCRRRARESCLLYAAPARRHMHPIADRTMWRRSDGLSGQRERQCAARMLATRRPGGAAASRCLPRCRRRLRNRAGSHGVTTRDDDPRRCRGGHPAGPDQAPGVAIPSDEACDGVRAAPSAPAEAHDATTGRAS
jgi:hypothetical protein